MKPIPEVIQEIVDSHKHTRESLAHLLGVSSFTVDRWISGTSQPRAEIEGQLREIHRGLLHSSECTYIPSTPDELKTREAIDRVLLELREILHRRGRLSSRNEALDELCKLLFAHFMSSLHNGGGISRQSVLGWNHFDTNPAVSLKRFVADAFAKHLPISLSHEMALTDFELRVKAEEGPLALEIIDCFEKLAIRNGAGDLAATDTVDLLNEVFGKFLAGSFIDEKQLGQYLTPTEVVKFMVRLAIRDMSRPELETLCDPIKCAEFGLILDPSCGVASFLAEVLRVLHREVMLRSGKEDARRWLENMVSKVVVGIDKSERMVRLALANMAMIGVPAVNLHLANSLTWHGPDAALTTSMQGKVKLILTNPPFGAEFEGDDLSEYKIAGAWATRPPAKVNSELLFMERYLDWLAPGGQLLAIVPDSILTNKGIYEDLRRNLANRIEIRSVISLPVVTFGTAGTNTKTSVLHIRKLERPGQRLRRSTTFFGVCCDIGYDVTTRETHRVKIANGSSDLPGILEEYSVSQSSSTHTRRVFGVEESGRWDAIYHASLPLEIEKRLSNPSMLDLFVSDVAELSSERTDPRRWGAGCFSYIEISDVDPQTFAVHPKTVECSDAPSRARKLVHAGDILFSTVRPERRTIGVVAEDQEGAVCTTGFAVLRPKGIHPLVLAHLLKTDFVTAQVMRNNVGIAYPAIEEACLLGILLPISRQDLSSIEPNAEALVVLESKTNEMRRTLANEVTRAVNTWVEENRAILSSKLPR